jgi:Papain family cysteine protease
MSLETLDPAKLQGTIQDAGGKWTAGTTSVSQLPPQQKKIRLGANRPAGWTPPKSAGIGAKAGSYPASYDLRNVNGQNFITAIKDQGGCGSCVAFGTTATVEGTFQVGRGNPSTGIDLSEADVYYCGGGAVGVNCETGWWPDGAFNYDQNTGVVDEACFPYTAVDQNCNKCSDAANRQTRISGWQTLTSTDDMKAWISTKGPLSACFIVYNDFFSYTSGIYSHVSGDCAGGHCISIIGYDDPNGCWIAKNSWGTGWGESGFLRIAYGQGFYPDSISSTGCGSGTSPALDSTMWAVQGFVATGWENGRHVLGLWAIDQDVNAWAYFDAGVGWRKISPDNDNILLDMLAQLASAKAAGSPVNFYEESGVIKQIYVL